MSAEEVRSAAVDGMKSAAQKPTSSTHDSVAAGAAAGVDKALQGAQAQGTGGGSVQAPPAGKPTADSVPATVEQAAVDESYKSGDSPYEFSQGKADPEAFKAEADRVYGK